ncbi:Crp/Fnr family transcriptional regulator [uncultured Sphingomonas sp.]|uniref:Crp/Fnr family transcriptional regulator n=1 Tax=uncultured Sphingomonas sp. TaxID=158754 RepID=UPI0035C97725
MRRSALTGRLERYLSLTEEERDALDWAERREVRVPSGMVLMEQGGTVDQLFVVQQGWLHSSIELKSGGRQILRFHYPGDLIGTSSIAWAQAANTITAVSDCVVSELSKVNLGRIFKAQPRLAGMLYAMAAAENVAMSDRLASIGRTDAIERLATLLLDILARLRVTAGGVIESFDLPLTQKDIGDAVGLTKVHVNRTLGEMERRGMIERNGRRVRIINEVELVRFTGFVDRYATVQTDWLPAPTALAA